LPLTIERAVNRRGKVFALEFIFCRAIRREKILRVDFWDFCSFPERGAFHFEDIRLQLKESGKSPSKAQA